MLRRHSSREADEETARYREYAELAAVGQRSAGARADRQREHAAVAMSDGRLASLQLSPGRPHRLGADPRPDRGHQQGRGHDGRGHDAAGLSREDAGRFAFLLATPAILAAGVLKLPELFGTAGAGIGGQIVVGSLLAGLGAYMSVRFLIHLRTRTLTPFGIYCIVAGLGQPRLPDAGQVAAGRPGQARQSPVNPPTFGNIITICSQEVTLRRVGDR